METNITQTATDLIDATDKKFHNVRSLLEVIAKQPEKVEEMIDSVITLSAQNDDNEFWTPAPVAAGALAMLLQAVLRGEIEGGDHFKPTGREIARLLPKKVSYNVNQALHLHFEV